MLVLSTEEQHFMCDISNLVVLIATPLSALQQHPVQAAYKL